MGINTSLRIEMKKSVNGQGQNSVDTTADTSTSSTTDVLISGMTLSPNAGTYLVLFNAQYRSTSGKETTSGFSTAKGVTDLESVYSQLNSIPTTNTTHPLVFGNGEVLTPGVYNIAGAISIAGTLTLDGSGDPNALFIIKGSGALNTGAGVNVVLTNGAKANNVFWIAEGAVGLGATTTIQGMLYSHTGAVSVGAGSSFVGRLFSGSGAISMNNTIASLPNPSTSNYVDYGVLQSLIIFTSNGALSNTANSTITGDVSTNLGAISGFGSPTSTLNGNIYPAGSNTTKTTTAPIAMASFSIYQDGILVANSTRSNILSSGQVSLQAISTILAGKVIDVRWNIDAGTMTLGNRILTVISLN